LYLLLELQWLIMAEVAEVMVGEDTGVAFMEVEADFMAVDFTVAAITAAASTVVE
jgi:hypothetical protein